VYNNILVINLMHIGDLMLVTPILRTLRENFPEAKLTLLTDRILGDLVRYNENLTECLLIDKKGKDNNLWNFAKFIFMLRDKKYDLVINLHRNERASALAAFSGAAKIIGYAKPFFSLFFTQVMPNLKAYKHQIHSHFDVLREGGITSRMIDKGLEMTVPPDAERRIAKHWREYFSPGERVVALNIGASWLTKRWIDDYFAVCADKLIELGYTVIFLGGSMDINLVRDCAKKMKYRPPVAAANIHSRDSRLRIYTGKLSLGEVAAVLRRCSLFITTDSGPMHIGVAMNVPIVTMFGSSPVPGFYPYDAKDVLIKTPEACHPCGKHQCPKSGDDHMACMKKIDAGIVMRYAEELLEKYHGEPAYKLPPHYGEYECRVIDLAHETLGDD